MKSFKIKIFGALLLLITSTSIFSQQGQYNNTLWTVAWSPDGKYIATGGNIDALLIYDGKTFEILKTYPVKDLQEIAKNLSIEYTSRKRDILCEHIKEWFIKNDLIYRGKKDNIKKFLSNRNRT